ncbi:cytochrome b5 [Manduca sexta]|uniref:Cytochrome b5 heme-binding domain-containing protein n=1 Tax=Manduca sexta TaxID=7130 RepID=A0A921YZE4_MANSE|nr:cytochrome b5 [Manduca sexta]KAG6448497.1 hypothetical protein O3G_MSEX005513 [Manduca sexta]
MSELPRYTLAEVATRNGKNNMPLWTIYKDGVYDMTKYMHEHPGGTETIDNDEVAGKDCTKAFEEVGHTSDAYTILPKYKIGEIVEEEKKYDANGKKKKRVVAAQPEGASRSCMSIITCGLLG